MANDNLAYQYDPEFYPEAPHVRRADIPPDLTFETMSDLGKELFLLSEEYAASGEKLYTEEEIEKELARRKGGYIPDDNDDDGSIQ
ncbi:MAG: hypothetical protein ACREEM_18545 [Blastocatellia bacterium]